MAGRIKGITVEINGDTTKLSKALQSVDKNIKNTQTQLKDVEKLLKLDPKNTEHKGTTGYPEKSQRGSRQNQRQLRCLEGKV